MTAAAIIKEIQELPPEGQSEVIQFAIAFAQSKQKTADELVEIAKQMIECKDPVEKDRLGTEFKRGFYGE
jgi:hypothetical protein